MVVGILEVFLNQVVVDVLDRQLGLAPVQTHRLEFQHDQCAGRILRQRLINPQTDLLAGLHRARDEVRLDQLLRYG